MAGADLAGPDRAEEARRGPVARPGPAARRGLAARILAGLQRAVLGSLMSLAVIVLERRLRQALRAGAGEDQEPPPGGTG
jgi:hypothetical protein